MTKIKLKGGIEMEKFKYCSNCGFKMLEEDRFCSNCGFDTLSGQQEPKQEIKQEPKREVPREQGANGNAQGGQNMGPNQNMRPNMNPNAGRPGPGAPKNSNTGLIIAISATVVLLLLGGGIYAALSMRSPKPKPPVASNPQQDEQENGSTEGNSGEKTETKKPEETDESSNTPKLDLSKAKTYLSKPGVKATFSVNYPDGTAGIVERTSSSVAPDPSVIVTEVETGVDMGEEYGFANHYVEREDGTYLIYDSTPYEIMPVMKNDLYVGKSWEYSDDYGKIEWTVTEMGINIDLGFKTFEDCVVVKEDNQAVGFQSLTYYAPDYGIVRVVDPGGATEYYRMTSLEEIGEDEASQPVIKWAPNYTNIKDDRTQTY